MNKRALLAGWGICALVSAAALAVNCYKIVTSRELIPDPTPGATCGNQCDEFQKWVPGSDCSQPQSSDSQYVDCLRGTVRIVDGVVTCGGLMDWQTYITGVPYCGAPCPPGAGGGGGEP